MRHMAGDGQHEIMVGRRHGLDIGPGFPPERADTRHRARICPFGRRHNAPAVGKQRGKASVRPRIFRARHRMGRHQMHVARQNRCQRRHHCRLDRARVGNDRAWFQSSGDLRPHGGAGPDWHAEHNQVGVAHRFRRVRGRNIGKAEFVHAFNHGRRGVASHKDAGHAAPPDGAGQRRADQAEADQRDAFEHGRSRGRSKHVRHARPPCRHPA